jgi:hypothetical protein
VVQGERGRRDARRAGRRRAALLRADAEVERERNRRLLASQRAAYGAAGIGLEGSPLLLQAQTVMDSIREQERIIAGASIDEQNARAAGDAAFAEGIAGAIGGVGQAAQIVSSDDWRTAFSPANARSR